MENLTRRSALVAASVAAATLVGTAANAQEHAEEAKPTDSAGKQRLRAATTTRIWRTFNFPNAAAATNFANLPPAQGPGEFVATDRENGSIDGFYFF